MVKRQQFTAEFKKREVVRQMQSGDKPVAQLSREFGVPRNRLYKWSLAVRAVGENVQNGVRDNFIYNLARSAGRIERTPTECRGVAGVTACASRLQLS